MMKLESNFRNMVVVLTLISLIAAGILGAVYTVTAEPIQQAKTAKQQAAIQQVLTTFNRLETDTVNNLPVHRAYQDDNFAGAAVEASSNGFGGEIKIMVGFDPQGNIIDYAVLQQAETPGLGTKIVDWFKTDKNNQSIKGKNPGKNNLTVSKDGGEVDAITAATISSRAFLEALQSAYQAYAGNDEATNATTGATSLQPDTTAVDSLNIQLTDSINAIIE
ncbi:MAG: RnfABCDGE type electron transport complex subunit G [Paludibacteraceae bacterium]|nr:RnfABCDGE type electron transport complex subunit G [Paludibacteraceae bacterium]